MKTLSKNLDDFHFCKRQKNEKNKCGRDFLYFVSDFYYPQRFKSLEDLDKLLGINMPYFLAWTLFQFINIGSFLRDNKLNLEINKNKITGFFNFFNAISFSKISYDEAIGEIENCVDQNIACGIDLSVGLGGLLDHVIFVYGYDDKNLYVFDTVFVKGFGYEQIPENFFIKKLPKKVAQDRWSRFGRFWKAETI